MEEQKENNGGPIRNFNCPSTTLIILKANPQMEVEENGVNHAQVLFHLYTPTKPFLSQRISCQIHHNSSQIDHNSSQIHHNSRKSKNSSSKIRRDPSTSFHTNQGLLRRRCRGRSSPVTTTPTCTMIPFWILRVIYVFNLDIDPC